jgi:hypothetical protein
VCPYQYLLVRAHLGDGHSADNFGMTKYVTKLIIVDADGDIVTAANGAISSDNRELVRIIKREVNLGTLAQLIPPFGRTVQASLDPNDLVGITAALFTARPGRTKLLEAPPEVWEWLEEDMENSEEESFGDVFSVEESRAMFDAAENFHNTDKSVRLLLGLDEEDNQGEK